MYIKIVEFHFNFNLVKEYHMYIIMFLDKNRTSILNKMIAY